MEKRLFCGIKINPSNDIISCYNDLRNEFSSSNISWVTFGNMHLTLKFLGEVDVALISQIVDALQMVSNRNFQLDFAIKDLGFFSQGKTPNVIWLGFEYSHLLINLFKDIDKSLSVLGFEIEKRRFSPHLTIARVKSEVDADLLGGLVDEYRGYVFQKIHVAQFSLFSSELKPSGAVYTSLASFDLQK